MPQLLRSVRQRALQIVAVHQMIGGDAKMWKFELIGVCHSMAPKASVP